MAADRVETRNACTAGYKAIWSKRDGFPDAAFFAGLDPASASIVDDKMSRAHRAARARWPAGSPTEAAGWTGLRPGTPVAVANVDAHVSVPAVGVTSPGTMVAVMGTSTCHLVLGDRLALAEGMCGVVEDGIIPGFFGYEAGQSAVGDIFGWFIRTRRPARGPRAGAARRHRRPRRPRARGRRPPARARPACSRSTGGTATARSSSTSTSAACSWAPRSRPAPRTSTGRCSSRRRSGRARIIESLDAAGVAVDRIVACGGLPERNALLMQLTADITGREVDVAASTQAPAVGSAMYGAVAAGSARGGYDSIEAAAAAMAQAARPDLPPDAGTASTYDRLYREYVGLHDYFGRGGNDVMKRLRAIRDEASASRRAGGRAGQRAGGAVDWRTISDGVITLTTGGRAALASRRVLDGQLDALGHDRGRRHPQRGQRRDGVAREQDVVEPHHRQVVRDGAAEAVGRVEHPEREGVGRGHDRRRRLGQRRAGRRSALSPPAGVFGTCWT